MAQIPKPFSRNRYNRTCRRVFWPAPRAETFPHLPAMDRNIAIDLESKSHAAVFDFEHRDFT